MDFHEFLSFLGLFMDSLGISLAFWGLLTAVLGITEFFWGIFMNFYEFS